MGENSNATNCADKCAPDCFDMEPDCSTMTEECIFGCDCAEGFVKEFYHPFAPCVLADECDDGTHTCMPEEVFRNVTVFDNS